MRRMKIIKKKKTLRKKILICKTIIKENNSKIVNKIAIKIIKNIIKIQNLSYPKP